MALSTKSLFLYGLQVTANNSSIDFRAVALETPRQATLRRGFYSLSSLATEISRALKEKDPARDYTVTIDRTVGGGLENRLTVSTSGAFFELLFASGPRTASNAAALMGFPVADQTGFTSYLGTSSSGSRVIPNLVGYNYLSPDFSQRNFGSVNISASGEKESIVFQVQEFWQVQFKYIPKAIWLTDWVPLMRWLIQQRPFEFTPEINSPNVVFEGTLEQSAQDGRGLAFQANEMLPSFPNLYDTGLMRFRKRILSPTFI